MKNFHSSLLQGLLFHFLVLMLPNKSGIWLSAVAHRHFLQTWAGEKGKKSLSKDCTIWDDQRLPGCMLISFPKPSLSPAIPRNRESAQKSCHTLICPLETGAAKWKALRLQGLSLESACGTGTVMSPPPLPAQGPESPPTTAVAGHGRHHGSCGAQHLPQGSVPATQLCCFQGPPVLQILHFHGLWEGPVSTGNLVLFPGYTNRMFPGTALPHSSLYNKGTEGLYPHPNNSLSSHLLHAGPSPAMPLPGGRKICCLTLHQRCNFTRAASGDSCGLSLTPGSSQAIRPSLPASLPWLSHFL